MAFWSHRGSWQVSGTRLCSLMASPMFGRHYPSPARHHISCGAVRGTLGGSKQCSLAGFWIWGNGLAPQRVWQIPRKHWGPMPPAFPSLCLSHRRAQEPLHRGSSQIPNAFLLYHPVIRGKKVANCIFDLRNKFNSCKWSILKKWVINIDVHSSLDMFKYSSQISLHH